MDSIERGAIMTALSIRSMNMTMARREQGGGRGLSLDREKEILIELAREQRDAFLKNARWAKKHGLIKDMQLYVKMACRFHRRLHQHLKEG